MNNKLSDKIIQAPCGTLLRVAHIVAVSPLFQSVELGTDAFSVYTVGSEEPFIFAALSTGEGARHDKKRKADTAKAHAEFIEAWSEALIPDFARSVSLN